MKRFAAAFVALMLCVGVVSSLAEVKKTEIVYAALTAEGKLKSIAIVNGFEADAAQQVTDYGAYSSVTNLSGVEIIPLKEGTVELSLPAGRFYYQGDPAQPALPWDIAISYRLDEADIAPQALSGAQGKLEATIDVKVNQALATYAAGSTLQVSVTLDGERCMQVQASKGTIASAGGNLAVTFVLLPGQEATFDFSAQVNDFAMQGIQFAGIRMTTDGQQYKKMVENVMQGNPMVQAIGPMMDNFISGMNGTPPVSFADARNGQVERLQFVLMTEEILPLKPLVTEAPVAEEKEDTVISRFLALFGR